MAFSYTTYIADGETTSYSVPIDFLAPNHVGVEIDLETVENFEVADGFVVFDSPPAEGASIVIRRTTPNERVAEFHSAAMLTSKDLNNSLLQVLYISQETRDRVNNLVSQEALEGFIQTFDTQVSEAQAAVEDAQDAVQDAEAASSAAVTAAGEAQTTAQTAVEDVEQVQTEMENLIASSESRFVPTGSVQATIRTNSYDGWLLLNGSTLGDTGSGGTWEGTEYSALYMLLWDSLPQSAAQVSGGGRGASALSDWEAGKVITLPDMRGRTVIGSGTGSGLTDRSHGSTGGTETHVLTEDEMPKHNHDFPSTEDEDNSGAVVLGSAGSTFQTNDSGNDQPHNNMQPYLALRYMIKT